ncbi:MAG: lysophospholipid acyltransferase family protein [Nocardioidaceae bacterium]
MRDIAYPPVILTAKAGFKALGLKFLMTGTEHIPRLGGAVLSFNHISYVDFLFGGFAAQPSGRLVRFMAKRELFDHKISGPLMRSLHHICVDRNEGSASYRTALEYLRAGEVVGIFPEATISRSFVLKDFKNGAARLASATGVPLIPITLWGTQRILTKDHARDLSRGKTIAITIGPPVETTRGQADADTERVRVAMSELLDQTIRSYPTDGVGQWWLPAAYGGTAPTPERALELDAEEARRRAARRRTEGSGR